MKKLLITTIFILISISITAVAVGNQITGVKECYPIVIDGHSAKRQLTTVNIENRVYVPIREMCELFHYNIKWNNENRSIEILTKNLEETIEGEIYTEISAGNFEITEDIGEMINTDDWIAVEDDTLPVLERGNGYNVDEENPIFEEGISEETALAFAHALFKQLRGEDYLEGKAISIEEELDGTVFLANLHFADFNTDGGDCSIVIRKSDGKILRIYWGE